MTKHLRTKQIFSIILALTVALSMMPVNVWAAENDSAENAVQTQLDALPDAQPDADVLSNEAHTAHCVCGKTHQTIGNHESEQETTFTEWTDKASLPTEKGAYYLADDVTISSNVTLSEDVTLCLNGHTVAVSGINIKGGTFTLTDCADKQGTIQGSGKIGVLLTGSKDSDTDTISFAGFVMYGGKITGFGNAVLAKDYSSFVMYGGEISGNAATSGAAVNGITTGTTLSDNKSDITMYGGEISGNNGESGGGVYIGQNCTFTLEGGKISNNTAGGREDHNPNTGMSSQYAVNGGGGVYLDSFGKFKMNGGEIYGNTATGNGGGVCVMTYASMYFCSINGGKISGNTVQGENWCGGGIYGGPAKLTIKNTEISGNKCAGSGGGVFATQPLTLEDVQIINNTANTAGGGVKIGGEDKNFKDGNALTVSGNTNISDNRPNNYYVDWSYLIPVKVSGELGTSARIGICMNSASSTDKNFLPTIKEDSVVATAAEGVTLSADNFFADSYNSDYVVRTDASGNVTFGLCDHVMDETGYTCKKCSTKFIAVLTQEGQKDEYIRDLSGAELSSKTGTLKLLQDAALTKFVRLYNSILTLDLNGHTFEGSEVFTLNNNTAVTVIDSSSTSTIDRVLRVDFDVNSGCTLNLYDGKNEQGFRGTTEKIKLYRAGTLVNCVGTISTLELSPSKENDSDKKWDIRLWQDNSQYCTIGTILYINPYSTGSKNIIVSDLLSKNHPGSMLYGTKSGESAAEAISGDTTIDSSGISGGYKNLYLKSCKQHEPKSNDDLICKECGAELVVKISATKGEETKVGYFSRYSKDTASWLSGYAEATAQLADWVADGYTDAKLFPLANDIGKIPVTCKMTLMGTGYTGINVLLEDGADVLLEGGAYSGITVNGGKATLKGETYGSITVNGGEAVFESGSVGNNGYFAVNDGTVTIKNDTTFTNTGTTAFQVGKGTLYVESGTIKSPVNITALVNLTISGGTFEGNVYISRSNSETSTCSISGGTFAQLTVSGTGYNLSGLLPSGCAYYKSDDDTIVNGEVKELTNVTVKSGHTHSFDSNTGACSECGTQMAASVTVGEGQPAYYETIEAAVAALNAAGNGTKTLKLFQDRKSGSATYTLEKGPVTLDLNGKALNVATFVAQGITLTLKSEKADGLVYAVQAVEGGTVVAKRDDITDDSYVTVGTISAQEGGQLALSAGTFRDLYVVNDGSKANLAGGTYTPLSYAYGEGPDKDTKYVGAYDLLAKGYGYQKKQTDGSFAWVTNGSAISETFRDTYKVAEIGAYFERIYPDEETNFTGDTYLIKLGENETTYTLKLTAVSTDKNKVSYQWQSEKETNWWINRPQKSDTAYEVDAANGTLTIKDLSAGTYRYRVKYTLKDSNGNDALTGDSQPLTVVVTKHEHSWTYELKEGTTDTITAKCTADDCYLTDKNGGSVTINVPAADTLTYDGNRKPATLTWTDWVDAATKKSVEEDVNSIRYTGSSNWTSRPYDGNLAPKEAGKYTASLTITNDDGSKVKAESEEYTLKKATLTVTGTPVATAAYNKNLKVQGIPISGLSVTFGSKEISGTWKFDSNAHPEVGYTTAYTATFKPKSTYDAGNYETLTKDIVPTITKGTYDGAAMAYTKNVLAGETQTGVEVSMMPYIAGVAIADLSVADDNKILNNVRHENGKVYFDVNNVPDAGLTATITLTYSSKNYENFTGTITVKTVRKDPVNITITGLPDTVTYGDEFTLEVTQTDDTGSAPNPWSWDFDETYFEKISDGINQGKFTLKLQAIMAGKPSKDITMTYESSTHKGSKSVTVSSVDKKTLDQDDFNIPKSLTKVYDGTDKHTADVTLSLNDSSKGRDIDLLTFTIAKENITYNSANVADTNKATLIVPELSQETQGNYEFAENFKTIKVKASITAKAITIASAAATGRKYEPNNVNVDADVTFDGVISGETLTKGKDKDYTVTGTMEEANAGNDKKVQVTVKLNNRNYSLANAETKTTVDIAKADAKYTAPTEKTNLVYNGDAQELITAGSTADGSKLVYSTEENGTYGEKIPTGKDAGNYTVWYKVVGDDNHNGTEPVELEVTIQAKTVTATVTVEGNSFIYNSEAHTPKVTVKDGDMVIDPAEYDVSYSNNTNAGEAKVTVTDKDGGNYTVNGSTTFTIAPLDIAGAVIELEDGILTYTGSLQEKKIKSVKIGKMDVLTYKVTDNTGTNAGDYTLTVTGTGNFTGTATKGFTIAKAKINVTGFEIEAKTYDGKKDAEVKSVSFDGLVNNETLTLGTDFTATAEFSDASAGTKTATVTVTLKDTSLAQNYALGTATFSKSVEIAKAEAQDVTKEVTAEVIYGDNAEKTASVANVNMPADAGKTTYAMGNTGAIDKVAEWNVDADGKVTFKISGANAGETITLSVVISSTNYNDVTVNVVITVGKAQSTISITNAADLNREYDGKSLTAQYNKTGDGDVTVEYFDSEGTSLGENAPTDAGTYKVVVTQAAGANYNGSKAETDFTIAQATVTTTDKPTQNSIYIGTKVSEATFKENKVTVDFNGTTTLEGKWSIVAKDGSVEFDKAGKYTCTATFKPSDKNFAPITIGDIEITVTNKPSGGGAAFPATEVKTTTEKNGETEKTVTTSPGKGKTETRTEADGSTTVISKITVSDENQKEIIKQVKDNNSEEIVIKVSDKDVKDGAKLELDLDKDFVDSIIKDTDAKLTIKTPAGDKTFTQEELKELSESASADGTITIDPAASEPAEVTKAEKIIKAKRLTEELKLVARSSKTAKKNVKVVLKKDKTCTDVIEELKELGFTVKYRFYRSTKKSAGYKSAVTKKTASYINTSGKKGTKYFYKVQVRVYDENGKLIAKTALKQCKYASRIWSR